MAKPHATRTFAPLQFEALEPHRFEDLVRDLMYDYRDWLSIEATGRSGSDDGYDIRAFERATAEIAAADDSDDDEAERAIASEGRQWMIQCKREKQLGPGRVEKIIQDAVDAGDPPYGYILAAPANFSKKAYDAFRATLSECGVQEFHLFGRAELEDMLYMPKNDRILFAFFGVSLSSKKRTRVSEIRVTVNNKNKLYTILGGTGSHDGLVDRHVLLRDINDTYYPDKDQYPDFVQRPRWREYIASQFYPDGLRFKMHRHFAYINREKKEWDFSPTIDLLHREGGRELFGDEDAPRKQVGLRERARTFWEHLPGAVQATLVVDGFVHYQNFAFIDKQGDPTFNFPHLYVDFGNKGPFHGNWTYLEIGRNETESIEEYKRVQIFPEEFPERKFGEIHTGHGLTLDPYKLRSFKHDGRTILLDPDGTYANLKVTDVIPIVDKEQKDYQLYAEVTHRYKVKFSDMGEYHPGRWEAQQSFEQVNPDQLFDVLELLLVYEHQLATK
jgi:hypothetical protein